jgi:NAD(P)H-dependent FMN reductase
MAGEPLHVLGISGSLRAGSLNTHLLHAAVELAPEGMEITEYTGIGELPHYNADLDGDDPPAGVVRLRDAIRAADGLLVVTPEYNYSIPGVLKNALDWVSRPLEGNPLAGKPVAILSSSTGSFGGLWAQNDLRRILGTLHARVIAETLTVPHVHTLVDEVGELAHPETSEGIAGVLAALTAELPPVAAAV